ncbi:sugar phosphate isomerase/epimerase [uncultured Dysosmobacter sp.]|uniref:sugar phosphate isomerase/epimerase family protein n=1 Tax=uncultured Dysosmobacter sp. TaxID=2591384 RepID=UPI0026257BFB|nr:sugar phosphate isomerase/epimerase family protein [uncultured Dysosmobacter sp.]
MNLAVETYVPRKYYDDAAAMKIIRNAGFDGIDLSFYWASPENDLLGGDYLRRAETLKQLLRENGLQCHQTHAPFDFHYGEAMDRSNPHYLGILRSIESSALLGAKQIVIHGIKVPEGARSEASLAYNYQYYKSFEPCCRKFGIQIGVENLITSVFPEPQYLNRMLTMLDSPVYIACIDLGHAPIAGTAPQDYLRGVLSGMVQGLHVHDNHGKTDEHMLPYIGTLDWDAITKALADIQYAGDFTLEIYRFLDQFDPMLLEHALAFAAKVGRSLIEKIEKNP